MPGPLVARREGQRDGERGQVMALAATRISAVGSYAKPAAVAVTLPRAVTVAHHTGRHFQKQNYTWEKN